MYVWQCLISSPLTEAPQADQKSSRPVLKGTKRSIPSKLSTAVQFGEFLPSPRVQSVHKIYYFPHIRGKASNMHCVTINFFFSLTTDFVTRGYVFFSLSRFWMKVSRRREVNDLDGADAEKLNRDWCCTLTVRRRAGLCTTSRRGHLHWHRRKRLSARRCGLIGKLAYWSKHDWNLKALITLYRAFRILSREQISLPALYHTNQSIEGKKKKTMMVRFLF